jgi:hypothetical protein
MAQSLLLQQTVVFSFTRYNKIHYLTFKCTLCLCAHADTHTLWHFHAFSHIFSVFNLWHQMLYICDTQWQRVNSLSPCFLISFLHFLHLMLGCIQCLNTLTPTVTFILTAKLCYCSCLQKLVQKCHVQHLIILVQNKDKWISINMHLCPSVTWPLKNQKPFQIIYQNNVITGTKNIKFLWLALDIDINWKSHVHKILSKLSTACYTVRVM